MFAIVTDVVCFMKLAAGFYCFTLWYERLTSQLLQTFFVNCDFFFNEH